MAEETPQVVDKRASLAGSLSKRATNPIILGVGAVVVLIVFATGGQKKKAAAPTPAPAVAVVPPSGLDDAVHQIQSSLERQQQQQGETAAASATPYALVPREQLPAGADPDYASVFNQPPNANCPNCGTQSYGGGGGGERQAAPDTRMASSVALSYRGDRPSAGRQPAAPRGRATLLDAVQAATNAPIVGDQSLADATAFAQVGAPAVGPQWAPTPAPTPVPDPELVVREGTILDTVLLNRLDGTFSGPVGCLVTNPIYSWSRRLILIPAGSRVLGQAQRVADQQQVRLAVTFHRLILPDGSSVNLQQYVGMNQIGDTGLKDQVNHHYLRMFGLSIALGSLSGLTQFGSTGAGWMTGQSFGDAWRQGAGYELANQARQQFTSALNALPTVTIREGHRVKVFLTQDLVLPGPAGPAR